MRANFHRAAAHAASLILAAIVLNASSATAQTAPGTSSVTDVTVEASSPMMGSVSTKQTLKATSVGTSGRVDVVAAEGPGPYMVGDYLLADDSLVYHVRPSTREYAAADQTGGLAMLQATGMSFTASEPAITVDRLGPAEPVAGLATERYRIGTTFTVSLSGGPAEMQMRFEQEEELSVAGLDHRPAFVLLRGPRKQPASGASPAEGLVAKLAAAHDALEGRMPLRVRSTMRMVLPQGMQTETRQSYDVSEIQEVEVDLAIFRLPDGFRRVEALPPKMQ